MRVIFLKGKQRELIKEFKSKNNLTIKKLAETLKIKEGKLRAYFYETSNISKEIYNKLDEEKRYKKYIKEIKEEGWRRKKGGKLSSGKTKKIRLPKENEKLAEIYGIMLGDGNLTKIKDYKVGTYMIRIVGDSRLDKEYLENHVKPIIEKLFDINVRIGKFKNKNAMFLESHGKELVNFFERKGFKAGNKIKNKLGIPKWIKGNRSFLKACLKGLYDTDGSAYKLTNQNSYQISFCNYNQKLLNDVRNSIISLGITPSKITKGEEFNITKKSELRKFLKGVGFSNPRHLNKVKMWKIAPSSSGQIQI